MNRESDTEITDEDLLERCLEHDPVAWSAFVSRFERLIFSVVYDTLRRHGASTDDEAVDELFATVFLALYDKNYRKLRQWTRRCSLASWIRLVTGSVVIDQLRRRRPTVSLDDEETTARGPSLDQGLSPLTLLVRAERRVALTDALMLLPAEDRELVLMLYRDERPVAEVAAALGIKIGALYTRKSRAITRLRRIVQDGPSS